MRLSSARGLVHNQAAEFMSYRSAAYSKKARPLVLTEKANTEPWIMAMHKARVPRLLHDIGCYVIREVGFSGRGYLYTDDTLIASPDVMPPYWFNQIRDDGFVEIRRELTFRVRRIERPVLIVTGHGVNVYGHALLEILMRLKLSDAMGLRPKWESIVLQKNAPDWLIQILTEYCGIDKDQIIIFDHESERLSLKEAFIPTLLWDGDQLHPCVEDLVDEIKSCLVPEEITKQARRIFISRGEFKNPASIQRSVANELNAAQLLRERFGFEVVRPELLSWRRQIALFANSGLIVGCFGSGLHNAIFSPSSAVTVSLGFGNMVQSEIATLIGSSCAFIPVGEFNGRSECNIPALERVLDDLVVQQNVVT